MRTHALVSGGLLWLLFSALAVSADAAPLRVGVSWSNFQEERWKTDEAAIVAGLEAAGARYLSADAQSSSEKQIADVEGLLARGAQVLILLAQDADAIAPALRLAKQEGVPVIAYDRLIESPEVFYLSFDNREVDRTCKLRFGSTPEYWRYVQSPQRGDFKLRAPHRGRRPGRSALADGLLGGPWAHGGRRDVGACS